MNLLKCNNFYFSKIEEAIQAALREQSDDDFVQILKFIGKSDPSMYHRVQTLRQQHLNYARWLNYLLYLFYFYRTRWFIFFLLIKNMFYVIMTFMEFIILIYDSSFILYLRIYKRGCLEKVNYLFHYKSFSNVNMYILLYVLNLSNRTTAWLWILANESWRSTQARGTYTTSFGHPGNSLL